MNRCRITHAVTGQPSGSPAERERRPRRRAAFTLIELVVVLTVLGVMTTLSVPSFRRSLERSRTEVAAANLQSIWSAQQLYWLEYRTYATSLNSLATLGLLDAAVVTGHSGFTYKIDSAGAQTFRGSATRTGSTVWTGKLEVDQTGAITGAISAPGELSIYPSTT